MAKYLPALVLLLLSTPVHANTGICGGRADVMKQLARQFHETPEAIGPTSSGTLLEVLTSADGKTWTIVEHRADGKTCIVRAGKDWQKRNWEDYACNGNPHCV